MRSDPNRPRRTAAPTAGSLTLLLAVSACGGPSPSEPLAAGDEPLEIVFGRTRPDRRHSDTRLFASSARGLGERRLSERDGAESDIRVHPDGDRIVFVRELRNGAPTSRELFVATLDGRDPEFRVTADETLDGAPCWSPDGERILFVSDRGGLGPRLWTVAPDGSGLRLFFDDGAPLADPDWSPVTDRVVVARGEAGRTTLWTIDAVGRAAVPLTDASAALADDQPCWSPDGTSVAFRRRLDPQRSQLARVDVATRQVNALTDADGEVQLPRWSPDGTRLLFARSWPELGIALPRLVLAAADGRDLRLLHLDKRYALSGLDVLPGFRPIADETLSTADADVGAAEIVNAFGRPSRGFLDLVLERDGAVYGIATEPTADAEVAGIEFRVPMPVAAADSIRRVTMRITAGIPEGGTGDVLRVSVSNVVEGRSDTLVERTPDGSLQQIEFTFASLAHVDRDGRVSVAVIAERPPDRPGELRIDHLAIRVEAVAPPD